MSDLSDEKSKGRVPNYAKPNLASRLPTFLGSDQEAIKAAFAPGSYTTISQLGSRYEESVLSLTPSAEASVSFKSGGTGKFFTEFEYTASPYDLCSEIKASEQKEHHAKMQQIAGGAPFVAPGKISTMKYEGTYEYQNDPYDTVRDEALRNKWMEERKVLAGPFIPCGTGGTLTKPTRAMLTDIMSHLYKMLYEDWEEAKPTVFTTAEDLIVLYFSTEALRSEAGILAYMNVFVTRNTVVRQYDLNKVHEGWNISTEDGHLMFTLRPPWVKERRFAVSTAKPPPASS